MVSLLEYYKEIMVTAGGIITFIVGRKSAKVLEKKQQADAIDTMQKTYDVFLKHYQDQYNLLTGRFDVLQQQFEIIQKAYKKEVETSESWEKQHKDLEKKYTDLERLYEKLKNDFERYKKGK